MEAYAVGWWERRRGGLRECGGLGSKKRQIVSLVRVLLCDEACAAVLQLRARGFAERGGGNEL